MGHHFIEQLLHTLIKEKNKTRLSEVRSYRHLTLVVTRDGPFELTIEEVPSSEGVE